MDHDEENLRYAAAGSDNTTKSALPSLSVPLMTTEPIVVVDPIDVSDNGAKSRYIPMVDDVRKAVVALNTTAILYLLVFGIDDDAIYYRFFPDDLRNNTAAVAAAAAAAVPIVLLLGGIYGAIRSRSLAIALAMIPYVLHMLMLAHSATDNNSAVVMFLLSFFNGMGLAVHAQLLSFVVTGIAAPP